MRASTGMLTAAVLVVVAVLAAPASAENQPLCANYFNYASDIVCVPNPLFLATANFAPGPPVTDADKMILYAAFAAKRCYDYGNKLDCDRAPDEENCAWNNQTATCKMYSPASPSELISLVLPKCDTGLYRYDRYNLDAPRDTPAGRYLFSGNGLWSNSWFGTCLSGRIAEGALVPCAPSPAGTTNCLAGKPDGKCAKATLGAGANEFPFCYLMDYHLVDSVLFDTSKSTFAGRVNRLWEACALRSEASCLTATFSTDRLLPDVSAYENLADEVARTTSDVKLPLTLPNNPPPSPTSGGTPKPPPPPPKKGSAGAASVSVMLMGVASALGAAVMMAVL